MEPESGGDPFFREIQDVYDEIGGDAGWLGVLHAFDAARRRAEIEASGLFADVTIRRFDWEIRYSADAYIRLLDTFSSNLTMEPWQRDRLYGEIRRRLALRPDGQLRRHWGAVLNVARRQANLLPARVIGYRGGRDVLPAWAARSAWVSGYQRHRPACPARARAEPSRPDGGGAGRRGHRHRREPLGGLAGGGQVARPRADGRGRGEPGGGRRRGHLHVPGADRDPGDRGDVRAVRPGRGRDQAEHAGGGRDPRPRHPAGVHVHLPGAAQPERLHPGPRGRGAALGRPGTARRPSGSA